MRCCLLSAIRMNSSKRLFFFSSLSQTPTLLITLSQLSYIYNIHNTKRLHIILYIYNYCDCSPSSRVPKRESHKRMTRTLILYTVHTLRVIEIGFARKYFFYIIDMICSYICWVQVRTRQSYTIIIKLYLSSVRGFKEFSSYVTFLLHTLLSRAKY